MKYSIKDLAEIMGCTKSAIRYFEKENLIHVEKGENGYRHYNIIDVFRLLSYTKYRSMEIPIKTIVKQFGGSENDRKLIQQREEDYKNKAFEKASYYQKLGESIQEHINSSKRIDLLLNNYKIENSPEMYVLCSDEYGWISKDVKSQKIINKWVKGMPFVKLGVLSKRMQMSSFGYFVKSENLKKLNLPLELKHKKINKRKCLHTIVLADEDFAQNPEKIFDNAIKYAKQNNLEIGKDCWGNIILVEVEQSATLHPYVELWISLK